MNETKDLSIEIQDMVAELEEYYECAGFADFYERVLKPMTDDEIREYYRTTFIETDLD